MHKLVAVHNEPPLHYFAKATNYKSGIWSIPLNPISLSILPSQRKKNIHKKSLKTLKMIY